MATVLPGEAVLELMQNATNRIVIAAPYIKISDNSPVAQNNS